jgi:hypothetical protein
LFWVAPGLARPHSAFGIMKQPFKILSVLVFLLLFLFVIWLILSPVAPRGTASVLFLGLTNTASGQPGALLCFTNGSSVRVVGVVHSVDYKNDGGWLTNQPVPGVVAADVASSADLGPREARVVPVRFPTNAVWRLRIRYHEQPRGPQGAFVRLGDVLTALRDRVRRIPVSFSGRSFLTETGEIVPMMPNSGTEE